MTPNGPLFITVKTSAKRFVVAKRIDVSYQHRQRRPIARYEAITVPLSFADAERALNDVLVHGLAGLSRQSRTEKKIKEKPKLKEPEVVTTPEPVVAEKTVVVKLFDASCD